MELTYTLSEGEPPRKVYNVLKNEFYASAGLRRRLKRSGGITIGGENAFTDRILLPGETLCADITSCEPECDIVPERGETEILWETDGLLAVNKPAGQLVHPSRAQYNGTLSNYVAGYLLETAGFSHCHAVNRLDRDTSGVVPVSYTHLMEIYLHIMVLYLILYHPDVNLTTAIKKDYQGIDNWN